MSRIRSSNTKVEMVVRRLVFGMGYRYRLHAANLPGRPDIVFRSRMKVIFVHGCFWHQHRCRQYRMPRSKLRFWEPKLRKNVARDKEVLKTLASMGWSSLVIWECQLKDIDTVSGKIRKFLEEN